MSIRWFYEIDGQIVGPVEQTRLRLLADSGMLQPHHRVRKENGPWHQATEVKGLFTPVGGIPVAAPAPRAGASVPAPVEDSPFGEWAPPIADKSVPAGVFDFFAEGDAPPPTPPPPKPTPKPAKVARPAPVRKAPEPPKPTPPPAFAEKPAPELVLPPPDPLPFPVAAVAETEIPEAVAEPVDEGSNPFAFEPSPIPATVGANLGETKLTVSPRPPEPIIPTPMSVTAPAMPELPPVPPPPAPEMPAAPAPTTPVPEISGRAVELLSDHSLRLVDGRTTFRLHRAWLLAVTRYSDGTSRMAYLRLQRIDAGVIEQRHEVGRGKQGSHSVLVFHAGELSEGFVFEGSDKPYRAFIEKVLLHGSVPKPSGTHKG